MANILADLFGKLPFIQQLRQERGELAALRQLYGKDVAVGLIPGRYYQQVDSGTGNCKGVSYVCHCGQEYRLLSIFECFRQGYRCPNCKDEINVLKYVGATDAQGVIKVKAQELEALLSKLPVRPVGVGESATQFLPSDDGGSDIAWQGKPPLGSDGRWI